MGERGYERKDDSKKERDGERERVRERDGWYIKRISVREEGKRQRKVININRSRRTNINK